MLACPFTILVDSAEGHPFTFDGIRLDANNQHDIVEVPTRRVSLGRYPDSYGDYSIEGYVGEVGVERKSMEDIQSTVLGWGGAREHFESELKNLSQITNGIVVVEADFYECMREMPAWGKKTREVNSKIFFRSVLSYKQRFKSVQWEFCPNRRYAEIYTFRWLWRWWEKYADD